MTEKKSGAQAQFEMLLLRNHTTQQELSALQNSLRAANEKLTSVKKKDPAEQEAIRAEIQKIQSLLDELKQRYRNQRNEIDHLRSSRLVEALLDDEHVNLRTLKKQKLLLKDEFARSASPLMGTPTTPPPRKHEK
jgi:esterase/lipase